MRSPEHRNPYISRSGKSHKNDAHFAPPEAFRVLPPDNDIPPPDPPAAPQPYRLTPSTRRHKNMAFAIVAETGSRPGSRSPSPSGRVSPFRGRGFNPTGSRHASPVPSPPPPAEQPSPTKIPKLQRRGSAAAFGERVTDLQSSPNRRKSKLNPQLSQSLTNISSKKPPPSPRYKTPAFQRLSPIVGSSPEPSQSQSSPKNVTTRSQPQSRFNSPSRPVVSKPPRGASRPASRNPSRNASRETSPSKNTLSPTRIPVKSQYKNVQAKVNSFHRPKPKVPPKPQVSTTDDFTTTEDEDTRAKVVSNKRRLQRRESVSTARTNSRANIVNKPNPTSNSNNNNNKNSSNKDVNGNKSGNNNNSNNNKSSKSATNNNKEKPGAGVSNVNGSNKPAKAQEPMAESSDEDLVKTASASPVKLSDLLQPSTTAVVSSTTSTVTQPLKIEAKLESDKTISPIVDGRVLSATSVSNAMNRMNDTVLNTQTLMKEHGLPKLSPAATTIIAMSQESRALDTKNATSALPSVETVPKKELNHVPARVLEQHVQNNMSRLISPEHNNSLSNNSVQKSVNERIKEARTVVAHDVKPIKITVKEKPMDVEVQSGNIRFDTSNGLNVNERPGLPPSQNATNNPPQEAQEQPPKGNVCTRMFSSCRKKISCSCCTRKNKEPAEAKQASSQDSAKTGCFNCRKKPDVTISIEDEEEPKRTFWERLKCCGRNKVGDSTTGCFSKNKRKDSWAERRDSILSAPPLQNQKASRCSKECCSGFFRKIFCINMCCKSKKPVPAEDDRVSRRASMMSKKKSLTPSIPHEDIKPKIDLSLVEHSSHMKGAIPVLPVCLAWFCLVMNCIAPGTGTVFSGMFCLCIGKPRFSQKDGPKPRIGAFIIDLFIGFGQFFTVLFCLVGWGWSIWWGVIMVKVARRHQKIKIMEQNVLEQEAAAAARAHAPANQNHHSRNPERRP